MQITYVGPFDSIEIPEVGIVARNASVSVSSDLAGHPPVARLAVALADLVAATEAIDHPGAAALRKEIAGLDHGEGLLAQPSNWVPAKKKDEVSA